jgi:hypothetical protein
MLHRDEQRVTASATYAQELEQALSWLLAGISDTSVLFRKDCGWNVSGLIAAALVWAWSNLLRFLLRPAMGKPPPRHRTTPF